MADNIYELKDWLDAHGNGKFETACFTGHRPKNIFGYDKARYVPLVNYVKNLCAELNKTLGTGAFISGGAQGFDQISFWAVNNLRRKDGIQVQNKVYAPFEKQPDKWRYDGLFGRQEYKKMLDRATSVNLLFENPESTRDAIAKLMERNHEMVKDSDIVIALLAPDAWDYRTSKGGTAECVRYARGKGKPVIAIRFDPDKSADWEAIVIAD